MKVAIAQAAPAFHNREATLDRLEAWVERAAEAGCKLVAFPESWIPGYPIWLDACRDVAIWDHPATKRVFTELREQSVVVPGPTTDRIGGLAARHAIVINVTVHERVERGPGNGTLFNTMLTFDADGSLIHAHRKLMPTFTERLIWGHGDGRSLHAVDTAAGRISGLICWEHWMPLPRQVLHDSGEQIHIAAWPQVKEMNLVASRHYAFEGRCFVLATGGVMRAGDMPDELERIDALKDDEALALKGGSCIVAPNGEVIAGPLHDEEGLVTAELDLSQIDAESMALDTSGHYARPDLFKIEGPTGS